MNSGTPLWVVSEVLGHASVAITKDVYGHLIGDEKQGATEAISDALFRETQPPDGRWNDWETNRQRRTSKTPRFGARRD